MLNKRQNIAILFIFLLVVLLCLVIFRYGGTQWQEGNKAEVLPSGETAEQSGAVTEEPSLIRPDGKTLQTRIATKEGYGRKKQKKGSMASFLRDYPLKKHGSPVLYYNGKKKSNQRAHAAVFRLPIEDVDLQQCADSIMRIYAEYYWQKGEYDKIAFHFVSGFLAEYGKWRQGWRIEVGDTVSWVKSAGESHSYEDFQEYMRVVFTYASTLSMEKESVRIRLSEIRAGDILIKGGSPGHVVMVVDVCEDADGKKAFLLAQGFMPAQEFHLLKNPLHEKDPWYYEEEVSWPLETPEYIFEKGCLMRPQY